MRDRSISYNGRKTEKNECRGAGVTFRMQNGTTFGGRNFMQV